MLQDISLTCPSVVEAINEPTYMTKEEKEYMKQMKENGVDVEVEEDESEEDEESKDESETEEEVEEESEEKEEESESESEEDEEEEESDKSKDKPKKESIYDAYKTKKKEVKDREQEIADLKTKLEAYENADTEEEKEEAQDELEKFAKKIKADPQALKEMRELFLKDVGIDSETKKDLQELKEFKAKHAKEIALNKFNDEFSKSSGFLKELFPKVSQKESDEIKAELEKMVHSKGEWNDKSLDYVLFKNKDKFSKMVSPKKKGLESRDNVDEDFEEGESDDFDPSADLSKMSAASLAVWEKKYNALFKKSSGLSKDSKGRKVII